MTMTISEKILAAHCGREEVKPGDLVLADVDIALGNDITAPIAIREFKEAGGKKVWHKDKVVLVPDHFTPNKDIASAEQAKILRDFSEEQGISHYYEVGKMGIEHALLPEQGVVSPGDLIIGADSHTCTYGALGAFSTGVGSTDLAGAMLTGQVWFRVPESMLFTLKGRLSRWVSGKDLILMIIGDIGVSGARYRSMEFRGETIDSLSMEARLALCNMAIEAGAKNGIIVPDGITAAYVQGRMERPAVNFESDADAIYMKEKEYDISALEPQVAAPHLPENSKAVSAYKDVKIDQVVIGSCTNGRLEDMEEAHSILKGRKVAKGVRLVVIPATQDVFREMAVRGLMNDFVESGAAVSTPTCGPCLGGHMGVLAEGERAIATTNRNFIGRMGHPKSEVYLSNPAVAAASAVTGIISHPDEVVGKPE